MTVIVEIIGNQMFVDGQLVIVRASGAPPGVCVMTGNGGYWSAVGVPGNMADVCVSGSKRARPFTGWAALHPLLGPPA
jgi:hypothetical protein